MRELTNESPVLHQTANLWCLRADSWNYIFSSGRTTKLLGVQIMLSALVSYPVNCVCLSSKLQIKVACALCSLCHLSAVRLRKIIGSEQFQSLWQHMVEHRDLPAGSVSITTSIVSDLCLSPLSHQPEIHQLFKCILKANGNLIPGCTCLWASHSTPEISMIDFLLPLWGDNVRF